MSFILFVFVCLFARFFFFLCCYSTFKDKANSNSLSSRIQLHNQVRVNGATWRGIHKYKEKIFFSFSFFCRGRTCEAKLSHKNAVVTVTSLKHTRVFFL